jgi:hypothetical protein
MGRLLMVAPPATGPKKSDILDESALFPFLEAAMSLATQTPFLAVTSEVLAFASEQGVSSYLPAVMEMTQRRFPDARRFAMLVEEDPEIANDRHIVIAIDLAGITAEQYVERDGQWGHELFQICPAPVVCVFRLRLEIIGSDRPGNYTDHRCRRSGTNPDADHHCNESLRT